MGGHDDHIEHHGNGSKELLQVARIRSLKEIQEEVDVLEGTLGIVTPTLL
jgi:hypothetical protein